jgi:S1-C subfamily serine protease
MRTKEEGQGAIQHNLTFCFLVLVASRLRLTLVVDTLIADGQVIRPVLGISYLESRQARALGIVNGVLVLDVPPDSPAAKAGLKGTRRTEAGLLEIGDIIIKVGSIVIMKESDLFQALEDYKPGQNIDVVVSRVVAQDDELVMQEKTLTIELQPSTIFERKMAPIAPTLPVPIE